MKWRAISIVSMMIMSALFIGAGSTIAAPLSGTITLMDGWNGNVQDYFEPNDDIYFDVIVLDAGSPLQSQWVDVIIYGYAGTGEVFNESYQTDSFGQLSGDDLDDLDEPWITHLVGDYIMYVNYSGQEVVSKTFIIYDPVPWTADCWTAYYGEITDIFTEDQRVEVYVQAFDQSGNPYDGNYGDVWYSITHNGGTVDTEYLNMDNSGEDMEYFYPEYQYPNQFGTYMVTIYNDAVPAQIIGFHNFTVELPDRANIWPQHSGSNRTVFTEGETVGYEAQLFYDDTIPYDSEDSAARILLYHESDMQSPLRNNSLRTNNEGTGTDWNYYNIGFGDWYKGIYYIMVYNYTWNIIGTEIFMVIDMEIELLPNKWVYSQGDEVQISISTSLDDVYTVKITDSVHTVIASASWNVPAGTHEWLREFTFPEIDDGTYHVDVYMGSLLLSSMNFELKKFTMEGRLSQSAFLPGQSGTLFWRAVNNHDGGPINIEAETEMSYRDEDHSSQSDALDDLSGSVGSFGFTVPRDALMGSSADIDIDAEDNADHSDHASVGFNVGSLDISVNKDRTSYRPGESVYLSFFSTVSGTGSMVPNVEIRARAQYDGVTVGDIWTVMTDANGQADFVYQVPSGAEEGLYIIVMNATFDDNRDIKHNETSDFTVSNDPVIAIMLYQEMSVYSPGSTISIPYRVLSDGVEISTAQVSFEARMGGYSFSTSDTIALGFGGNGVITFTLPENQEGLLYIQATALTTDGFTAFNELSGISITDAQLTLFTTKSIYLPGENITWLYVLRGETELSATYRITGPFGVLLAQGTPANGSIIYRLSDNYPITPTLTVYITTSEGDQIISDTAAVFEGYYIEFRVLSSSYAPGDILEINYTITKIGHGPEVIGGYMVQINIMGQYTDTVWVTEDWGILSYQLPEDIQDGRHLITVTLPDQSYIFSDYQTVIVDSDAGELAHGTIAGMNAGAFIALLIGFIGLIIAIIGVMMARNKAKAKVEDELAPAPPLPVEETIPEPVGNYPAPDNMESTVEAGDYPPPPPPENY